jgi:hypothetical protein
LEKANFPVVRYLDLDLVFPAGRDPFLEKWTLGSLRTFSLRANFLSHSNGFSNFISKHKETLSELSISNRGYTPGSASVAPILSLFDSCPEVEAMGINMDILELMRITGSWTRRQSCSQPTVLVYGFEHNMGLPLETLAPFLPLKEHWNAKKIVFAIGWKDLRIRSQMERRWEVKYVKRRLKELLDTLEDINVPILDQYGTSLWDFLEDQIRLQDSEALNIGFVTPSEEIRHRSFT